MRIMRNYITRQLIGPFLATFSILTSLLVILNLRKLIELIVNKGVSALLILKLFGLQIPSLQCYTIPLAILTTVLLVFGRLAQDNEITAMRAAGINLSSVFSLVALIGIIISLSSVILNDTILSQSRYLSRLTLKEMIIKYPTAYLEEGVFIKDFPGFIVYVHEINKQKMKQIRIYELKDDEPTTTIIAKNGEFKYDETKGKLYVFLSNGTIERPDPNNPGTFYKLNFKRYRISLNPNETFDKSKILKKPKDMNFDELAYEIKNFKKDRVDPLPLQTEFFKRLSLSFSSLTFVLFALPIGIITRRREIWVGLGLSIGIAIFYYLLLIGSESVSLRGILSPSVLMLIPNIFIGFLGLVLFWKIQRV